MICTTSPVPPGSGLGAVGYATAAPERMAQAAEPPLSLRLSAAVARLRQAIGRRVVEALPGSSAIANALITGERGGISEANSTRRFAMRACSTSSPSPACTW